MGDLLTILAIILLAMALGALAAALLARRWLLARHRVAPGVPTEAPLAWLVDPRAPARLHRRLGKVGTAATMIVEEASRNARTTGRRGRRRSAGQRPAETSGVGRAAEALRQDAVSVDAELARIALLPPKARRGPLADINRNVADLEAATARLIGLQRSTTTPDDLAVPGVVAPDPIAGVDLLARAHEELAALDRDSGLAAGRPTDTGDATDGGRPPGRRDGGGAPRGGSASR